MHSGLCTLMHVYVNSSFFPRCILAIYSVGKTSHELKNSEYVRSWAEFWDSLQTHWINVISHHKRVFSHVQRASKYILCFDLNSRTPLKEALKRCSALTRYFRSWLMMAYTRCRLLSIFQRWNKLRWKRMRRKKKKDDPTE